MPVLENPRQELIYRRGRLEAWNVTQERSVLYSGSISILIEQKLSVITLKEEGAVYENLAERST